MFVLINGAFGIGKTAVAAKLRERLPGSAVLNPERVGFLLQHLPGYSGTDFQDSPAWRKITIASGRALGLIRSTVIVPMAFSEVRYLDEIRRGFAASGRPVLHFCLVAPLDVVESRLAGRGEPQSDPRWAWVHRRAAECCEAHAAAPFAVHVPTASRTIDEIAGEIVTRIQAP